MLIEFSVENFRSIADKQTFSMVKARGSELLQNTFAVPNEKKLSLLKSTAIFGANASGKTNLILAISTMRDFVLESAQNYQKGDQIPTVAFAFDKTFAKKPSTFEVFFIENGVRYQFGFIVDSTKVLEEWLIAYPNARGQLYYERVFNEDENTYNYKFGSSLQGQKQIWREVTRDNGLFLSTAILLNSQSLKDVFNWFKNKLLPLTSFELLLENSSLEILENPSKKNELLSLLRAADLNFYDIVLKQEKLTKNKLAKEIPNKYSEDIFNIFYKKEQENAKTLFPKSIYLNDKNEKIELGFNDESDGTLRFFQLAGILLKSLEEGRVLLIDEINMSLHSFLVTLLLDLFHNEKINSNKSQLVFTTHDTSLLDSEFFRRDQIWFCEKTDRSSTIIYPLSDFNIRKSRENLEKKYLSGRFGAVPFIENSILRQ